MYQSQPMTSLMNISLTNTKKTRRNYETRFSPIKIDLCEHPRPHHRQTEIQCDHTLHLHMHLYYASMLPAISIRLVDDHLQDNLNLIN